MRVTKGLSKVYDPEILTRKHERIYIGIVLSINGYSYFAPFSSAKKSDYVSGNVRNSTLTILRMVKPNSARPDGKELLGTITLNNMIPVPSPELTLFDVANEPDIKYKNLVIDEMRWVAKNDTLIKQNAITIYHLKTNESTRRTPRNASTLAATIDFIAAENACDEWMATI